MSTSIWGWAFRPTDEARQKLRLIEKRVADLHDENTRLAAENHDLRDQLNESRAAIVVASEALFAVDTTPITEAVHAK